MKKSSHTKKSPIRSAPECSICLEVIKKDLFITICEHTFHLECLKGMISFTCPICRAPLKPKNGFKFPSNFEKNINERKDQYLIEVDEEATRETINSLTGNFLRPRLEIGFAIIYLKNYLGINSYFIENFSTNPTEREDQNRPSGYYFENIVKKVLENIHKQPNPHPREEDHDSGDGYESDDEPISFSDLDMVLEFGFF